MRRILLDSQHNALAAKTNAARFERLMNITNAGVLLLKEGRILDANPMMEVLFSCSHQSLIGYQLADLFDAEEDLCAQMLLADGRPYDRQAISGDGRRFAAEISLSSLEDGNQVAEIRDVSERKLLEEELRRLASRDPLTGALNRRSFSERSEHELIRSRRQGNPICLAAFDLDHFKRVNDNYGHAVGDLVLQRFAVLCQTQLRRTDHFARFGGEEFVLLLADTDPKHALVLLERLREQWAKETIDTSQGILQTTVSIGLAQLGDDESLERLLARADAALYQAKRNGRNCIASG
jgi:diguanylate cyclase (GGDEF)-like protein/PAS domain S-box-containing protein